MRDARINPVAGDVLAIGVKQWEVMGNSYDDKIELYRDGSFTRMNSAQFRCFFKLASTVRYGDEGK